MVLDDGSLQAARLIDIKLGMVLDDGSLQAARLIDIKLDLLLDDGYHTLNRHDAR